MNLKASRIILITVDTLRADRLGCYGCHRPATPNLDSLAREGTLFRNAFTPCSYTVPTHSAILTGRYPANLPSFFYLFEEKSEPDRQIMLQEVLADRGYKTAAFVSAHVLNRKWGLDTGFGVYDDETTRSELNRPDALFRSGEETNARLFGWLEDNRDSDFFAWVHYFDVHGPYSRPEPYASSFRREDYGVAPVLLGMVPDGAAGGIPQYQLLGVKKDGGGAVVDYERDARFYISQYDAGVSHADRVIGSLMDKLRGLGIYDDTVVIVTSDHGEALGENGVYFFHGLTVTPDQIMVPLIVKPAGGLPGGEAVEDPVSTIDIMPTVLELTGIGRGPLEMDGAPLAGPGGGRDRFIISENEWQRAIIYKDYCLLKEKAVIRDGFAYYFDSKDLCGGERLFNYKTGEALDGTKDEGLERLKSFSEFLYMYVDPKEVTIRCRDIENRALAARLRSLEGLTP